MNSTMSFRIGYAYIDNDRFAHTDDSSGSNGSSDFNSDYGGTPTNPTLSFRRQS